VLACRRAGFRLALCSLTVGVICSDEGAIVSRRNRLAPRTRRESHRPGLTGVRPAGHDIH
jgi:hypothetical protein